ncbi:MAG TPA: serine/threonine-protein kinase [Kofleriaceae bacterium]|nr:serine/threonine-protein kinase [Kofleriaceae bacterium]
MGRALAVIGVIVILAGGAAIGFAVTRSEPGGSPDQVQATGAVSQLDGDIKAARSGVRDRAQTLSTLLAVRAAIVTNTETVKDLVTRGDFTAREGEILELGRVLKQPIGDRKAGAIESLTLQPPGAMQMSHDGVAGSYAELVGDQIVLTEVVGVEPADQGDLYAGFLSVTRPLPLGPALRSLAGAGIAGMLVVGSTEIAIGKMPKGAKFREKLLGSPQDGAKIVVAEPPARAMMPVPFLVGGIGAAVIGLLLLVISVMRKADPAASLAFGAMPTQPATPPPAAPATTGLGTAQTQLSQSSVAATGTPTPVEARGAPQVAPSSLAAGSMIGRWEIVRRLGSGGMADVYLAQVKGDGGFEKLLAIKVMHGHLARTQRAVELFLDEARLAAQIHHPNVVAILELGKYGEDYVIAMEYVDGVDLDHLLTSARTGERPVPIAIGLGILCRICDGLDAAHRATSRDGTPLGIVHRDVKSANVLVSRQGTVKVVDFGIAKAATQVHQTVAGETKGTPSMMAPEQRVGEQVDVRADVYSVAAVGYEILTGHGVNLDLAALAHLGIDNWPHLPLPSSLRANLPPELDDILLQAMSFERDKRPADCAALEEKCQAVMKAHGLTASDKDIARWVEGELRHLPPAYGGDPVRPSKAPAV